MTKTTKDHPMLFKGEMVLSMLDGTKTCTRRTTKLDEINQAPDEWELAATSEVNGRFCATFYPASGRGTSCMVSCPYGAAGDRLWVKETWACDDYGRRHQVKAMVYYRASAESMGAWRSPLHMPRWASRITTTITKIGIERVGDITESDALAEGVAWEELEGGVIGYRDYRIPFAHCATARESFKTLWNHVANDDGRFDRNEWCWVIRFKEAA